MVSQMGGKGVGGVSLGEAIPRHVRAHRYEEHVGRELHHPLTDLAQVQPHACVPLSHCP